METDKVRDYLKAYYNFNGETMKTLDGDIVRVCVSSVSSREGYPLFQPPKKSFIGKERFFFLCGETENGECKHIKRAINSLDTDYIVSFEFLTTKLRQTYGNLSFSEIISLANQYPDVGVYRRRVKSETSGEEFNIVMIRVKEGGHEVRKYMDAYLASSDSCTYHDIVVNMVDYIEVDKGKKYDHTAGNLPLNWLLAGAPGTGKSYFLNKKLKENEENSLFHVLYAEINKEEAVNQCKEKTGNNDDEVVKEILKETALKEHVTRVTFYEDYSYENFVGCYKPIMKDDSISYEFEPGPFIKIYVEAKKHPEAPYVLVIEEINRAKAASVFGELFQLLDRDKDGESSYSVSPEPALVRFLSSELERTVSDIRLPNNMYIWATMNSADQGVMPLDAAFRRRWTYKYMPYITQRQGGIEKIKIRMKNNELKTISWDYFRNCFNSIILNNFDEDRCIGPWYFNDVELKLITDYEAAKERTLDMDSPLVSKLFLYLYQDVFRYDRTPVFKEIDDRIGGLSSIIEHMRMEGISAVLSDIIYEKLDNYKPDSSVSADNSGANYETSQPTVGSNVVQE